jgi:hypothetical protein
MTIQSLMIFITVMWIMVLAVAAFLVIAVPQIEVLFKGGGRTEKIIVSGIQAVISIGAVVSFIIGLSKLKKIYAGRKLHL